MKKIAVLGLGNLMRTDDAIGMLILESLRPWSTLRPEVKLIEGGTLGLDLLDHLWGMTHLVAVDAIDVGAEPGTMLRFTNSQLSTLPTSKSVHLLGFADLLGVLTLMNASPKEVILLGVQPKYTGWGTELTPTLKAKEHDLLQAVISQVQAWVSPSSIAQQPSSFAEPAFGA